MANDSALGGGGVLFTFILNIIIATIIFVLLGTCIRRMSPFAWEKKRKLFGRNLEQRNLYADERDVIAQEPNNKNYLVEIGNEDRPLAKNRVVRYVQQRILFTWELFKGFFYPVHDEERCMDNYGRDISAYFLFSRAIIYAFVFMTIVGLAVLLPLHLTGTLPEQYSTPVDGVTPDAGIVYTTINMITTSPARMSATIILTFFFTLAFLMLCVAYYAIHPMNSVHNWRQHDERKSSMRGLEALKPSALLMDNVAMIDRVTNAPVKDPLLVCPYSLEIDGLPSTLVSQTAFRAMVAKVMTREEPNKFGTSVNDIICANLVHDIKDRLDLAQKKAEIVKNIEHLNYVREQKEREGVEIKPVNKTLLCKKYDGKRKFKNSVDALEYEQTQLADVEREISRWDDMYRLVAQQTGNVNDGMQVQDMEVGEISDSGHEGRQRGARPLPGLLNQFLDKKGNDKEYKLRSSGNAYIVFRSLAALKDFERNFRKQRPNVEEALQLQQEQLGNEVTEGGLMGTIGGVGNKLTGGMSAKAMNLASLHKNRVKYEPGDVMWDNLFVRTRISRAVPIIRKTISVVLIILLIIFCSTPTAFATSIQRLLEGGVFPGINIRNIGFLTSGTLGALIFQYVPTLLLMLASILIPMIIIGLTMFEKNKSRGLIQTLTMKRIYVYLLLSTLVLPILVQASMDGLVNGFINGGANYALIFGNIFLPNGGSFFINYVLQKFLIGNMLAYVMVGMIVKYLIMARFTSPYWKKLKMYRYISPLEHLDTAELTDINVEMAYANMLSIAAIGLTLGVFTPVVIPCCLAFFLGQYWVDRYNVSTIYGQRKLVYKVHENANIVGSAAYGVRSDFVTHTKIVRQVCELVWANCIVFTFFMTFFFAARIAQNNGFIGHTIVAAIICIACIIGAILTKIIGKYYFLSNGRLDRQNGEVRPNEANVDRGYDPTTVDGFAKMKGGLGTLGFQLISRGI